ncbi:hypothetical protein Bca4012_016548 [Brassica carinata]
MLKQKSNNIDSEEDNRARACDTCMSTVCTVYCHADSAYLCTSCDAEVHSANRVASRHKRVPVCESCECAPAAFLCEADDASLCTACDSEVHSANAIARRHHRVPVLPVSGNSYISMDTHHQTETTEAEPEKRLVIHQEEDEARETASWLLPKDKNSNQNNELLLSDEYLDLADYNTSMDYKFTGQYNQHQQDCDVAQTNYVGDRVVPLQIQESNGNLRHKQQNMTYGSSDINSGSINHNNLSLFGYDTSMETDFVPEPTTLDTADGYTTDGKIDQPPEPPVKMIIQLSPMDREARAYAERRPRINGRFAKMGETEDYDVDQGFNSVLMFDTGYSIVPSF